MSRLLTVTWIASLARPTGGHTTMLKHAIASAEYALAEAAGGHQGHGDSGVHGVRSDDTVHARAVREETATQPPWELCDLADTMQNVFLPIDNVSAA